MSDKLLISGNHTLVYVAQFILSQILYLRQPPFEAKKARRRMAASALLSEYPNAVSP